MQRNISPTKILPIGFLSVILIGTLLLMLPMASTEAPLSFFDAFFEATSATCVTGLIVVDTATRFTFFGQLILLLLIQLGGLGFMTVATFFFVLSGKKISLKERMTMAESMGENRLQGIISLALHVLKVTAVVEGCGALLLSLRFIPQFGWLGGIWRSIFTSISAFCNAGFDLMGNYSSLTAYVSDPVVSLTICALILIGGFGFGVIQDILEHRKRRQFRMQTKVVMLFSLILVVIPSIVFFFLEYHNTMEGMDLKTRLLASLFQSVTCRTAGFNTIDQFALKDASKLLSILLMFIGGAPAGTAGGIKLTTVAVIFLSAKGLLAEKDRAQAFERWISKTTVIKACSIFFIATYALLFGIFLVSVFENGAMGFLNEAYELTSAIATVGLSVGISGSCSLASRAVICLLMFMGRVGILTIALAVGGKKEKPYLRYPEADIMVG